MTSESAMRPYGARKVANKDFNSKKRFVGKKHDQILFLTLNSQSLPPSSSQFTRHNPQQIPLVECIPRPLTGPHSPVLIPITSSPKTEASSVSSTNRIRVCEFLNFGRYSGDRVDVVVKQFLAPSTGCFFFKYIRFRLPELKIH
ncbi:hypothetical protein NC652_007710 [Populus alba x Populus x berolinensis]|nr:hypothetical protein NC652_007710 [Populus alba x Populus x berolinensis]